MLICVKSSAVFGSMAICPLFKRYFVLSNQTRRAQVVVACTHICITERRRAQLLLPNIESIEYVYIMHARSVMQQRKGEKREKRKEWKRDENFNWVRQGENTEVMFTVGGGNRCVWMSEVWE